MTKWSFLALATLILLAAIASRSAAGEINDRALLGGAQNEAADVATQERYPVFGVGLHPCSAYLSAYDELTEDMLGYVDWLAGYLSAFNRFGYEGDTILEGADIDEVLGWLYDWCTKNPSRRFAAAAEQTAELILEMTSRTATPASIDAPTQPVILAVQSKLKALGYYHGPLDGISGPRTRKAYQDWQQRHPHQSALE
jgi:Putative peptidoglycan binding domain